MAQSVRFGGKRLSKIVGRVGIASFNRDDFFYVTSKVSQQPDRLVLVGGQALETWGTVLKIPSPDGQTDFLTKDADWLGSRADAEWLAQLLGLERTEILTPNFGDSTPNTAIIYLEREDSQVLLMDFLRCVTGLQNQDIEALAVPIDIPSPGGGVFTLRVLHPLHCLISRMANLAEHPSKRQGNGPLQARWAVDIVHAYLNRLKAEATPTQVRKACYFVADMARYKYAEYCYVNYQLDPLAAITKDILDAGGQEFKSNDWPRVVGRVEQQRQKWRQRQLRSLERIKKHLISQRKHS